MAKTFTYMPIRIDQLSAIDLQQAAGEDPHAEAYSITIYDESGNPHAEAAQALYSPADGRLGIAWGADATWADVDGVERGIDMWLNDPDAWDAAL